MFRFPRFHIIVAVLLLLSATGANCGTLTFGTPQPLLSVNSNALSLQAGAAADTSIIATELNAVSQAMSASSDAPGVATVSPASWTATGLLLDQTLSISPIAAGIAHINVSDTLTTQVVTVTVGAASPLTTNRALLNLSSSTPTKAFALQDNATVTLSCTSGNTAVANVALGNGSSNPYVPNGPPNTVYQTWNASYAGPGATDITCSDGANSVSTHIVATGSSGLQAGNWAYNALPYYASLPMSPRFNVATNGGAQPSGGIGLPYPSTGSKAYFTYIANGGLVLPGHTYGGPSYPWVAMVDLNNPASPVLTAAAQAGSYETAESYWSHDEPRPFLDQYGNGYLWHGMDNSGSCYAGNACEPPYKNVDCFLGFVATTNRGPGKDNGCAHFRFFSEGDTPATIAASSDKIANFQTFTETWWTPSTDGNTVFMGGQKGNTYGQAFNHAGRNGYVVLHPVSAGHMWMNASSNATTGTDDCVNRTHCFDPIQNTPNNAWLGAYISVMTPATNLWVAGQFTAQGSGTPSIEVVLPSTAGLADAGADCTVTGTMQSSLFATLQNLQTHWNAHDPNLSCSPGVAATVAADYPAYAAQGSSRGICSPTINCFALKLKDGVDFTDLKHSVYPTFSPTNLTGGTAAGFLNWVGFIYGGNQACKWRVGPAGSPFASGALICLYEVQHNPYITATAFVGSFYNNGGGALDCRYSLGEAPDGTGNMTWRYCGDNGNGTSTTGTYSVTIGPGNDSTNAINGEGPPGGGCPATGTPPYNGNSFLVRNPNVALPSGWLSFVCSWRNEDDPFFRGGSMPTDGNQDFAIGNDGNIYIAFVSYISPTTSYLRLNVVRINTSNGHTDVAVIPSAAPQRTGTQVLIETSASGAISIYTYAGQPGGDPNCAGGGPCIERYTMSSPYGTITASSFVRTLIADYPSTASFGANGDGEITPDSRVFTWIGPAGNTTTQGAVTVSTIQDALP